MILAYVFLIGVCFGSFANVLSYRLPRGLSVIKPPSACPVCKAYINALDLIPVLSFFILKGRCRNCSAVIPKRYLFTELICAALFVLVVWLVPDLSAILLLFFVFILLAVSLIDWDTQTIPDNLIIAGILGAVVWLALAYVLPLPLNPGVKAAVLGAAAGGLPLFLIDKLVWLLYKKDGFGFGDVKLMAMAGLFLGWQNMPQVFIFAFISGGAYAVFLLVTGRASRGAYIPFGPFLSAGCVFALVIPAIVG